MFLLTIEKMRWSHVLWKMKGRANPVLTLQKTFNYGIKILHTRLKINHFFSIAHLDHENFGQNIVSLDIKNEVIYFI